MLGQVKADDFIFFLNSHSHKGINKFVQNPGYHYCIRNDDNDIKPLYEEQFEIAEKKTICSGGINCLFRKESCCD